MSKKMNRSRGLISVDRNMAGELELWLVNDSLLASESKIPMAKREGNADRLRDCWNACEGIEDVSALAEMRELLKQCLHARQCNAPWGQTEKYPTVAEFKRVLAKADGRED